MPGWTYNIERRRYREEDTGRELGERELRPLRERFLRQVTDRTLVVTGQLANRQITLEEWEIEMRRVVKDAFGTAYLLGRGGRNVMTQADWGRVGGLVGRQYRYLNEYARAIDGQTVTRERALSRSTLYVQAATQSYQRGQLAGFGDMPRLERVPGDGSTSCLVNCRCELQVDETDDGWQVYWLDLGDERECADCRQLAASWSPLQLSRPRAASSQEE
ncbi:MAG TPA: hypothetical protein VGJ60_07780 [Chloroflexota bacterium]|jgi:hypothetical protein